MFSIPTRRLFWNGGRRAAAFHNGAPFLLPRAAEAIAHQLDLLDRDLAEAASRLAALDLKHDAARTVIRQLQLRHAESVIDACTVSPRGIMLQVEPSPYRSFEGSDISDQEQIKTLMRTRKPVMSRVFQTVEGVAAIDLEHPVIGSDGTYRGSVSVIFQPWVLIGTCVHDLVAGMPVGTWAMQPDGTIIYDADSKEVGRILFTDPKYRRFAELLRLGRRIAAQSEGDGSYSYFNAATSRVIRKNAWWVSLSLHGTAWRLAIIHPAQPADRALRAGAPPFSRQALGVLAEQPALIQALAQGVRASALKLLRQTADHPHRHLQPFLDRRPGRQPLRLSQPEQPVRDRSYNSNRPRFRSDRPGHQAARGDRVFRSARRRGPSPLSPYACSGR